MGPKERRSSVLSKEEEALVVTFRRHTLLLLDDCLYALQPTIPHLTRSSLHRCFLRHEISRLPEVEESKPKAAFRTYPIGFLGDLAGRRSGRADRRRRPSRRSALPGDEPLPVGFVANGLVDFAARVLGGGHAAVEDRARLVAQGLARCAEMLALKFARREQRAYRRADGQADRAGHQRLAVRPA